LSTPSLSLYKSTVWVVGSTGTMNSMLTNTGHNTTVWHSSLRGWDSPGKTCSKEWVVTAAHDQRSIPAQCSTHYWACVWVTRWCWSPPGPSSYTKLK